MNYKVLHKQECLSMLPSVIHPELHQSTFLRYMYTVVCDLLPSVVLVSLSFFVLLSSSR